MLPTRRISAAIALSAAVAVALTGCQLFTPITNEVPPTAMQECALDSTWSLNTEALAENVSAILGIPVTVEGSQTLSWGAKGGVTIESDYRLVNVQEVPEVGTQTVVQTQSGTITGRMLINGDIAIPGKWDATGLEVVNTSDIGGVAQEGVPFAYPATNIDDKVGIVLTCEGDTLTTAARGGRVIQTWTRQG